MTDLTDAFRNGPMAAINSALEDTDNDAFTVDLFTPSGTFTNMAILAPPGGYKLYHMALQAYSMDKLDHNAPTVFIRWDAVDAVSINY